MNIHLGTLRNEASQIIIEKIKEIPAEKVNYDSVLAIIYAIEKCLGCSKTADEIAELIKKSPDIESTIQKIFSEDLAMNIYFFPDEKMHQLIQSLNGRIPAWKSK